MGEAGRGGERVVPAPLVQGREGGRRAGRGEMEDIEETSETVDKRRDKGERRGERQEERGDGAPRNDGDVLTPRYEGIARVLKLCTIVWYPRIRMLYQVQV